MTEAKKYTGGCHCGQSQLRGAKQPEHRHHLQLLHLREAGPAADLLSTNFVSGDEKALTDYQFGYSVFTFDAGCSPSARALRRTARRCRQRAPEPRGTASLKLTVRRPEHAARAPTPGAAEKDADVEIRHSPGWPLCPGAGEPARSAARDVTDLHPHPFPRLPHPGGHVRAESSAIAEQLLGAAKVEIGTPTARRDRRGGVISALGRRHGARTCSSDARAVLRVVRVGRWYYYLPSSAAPDKPLEPERLAGKRLLAAPLNTGGYLLMARYMTSQGLPPARPLLSSASWLVPQGPAGGAHGEADVTSIYVSHADELTARAFLAERLGADEERLTPSPSPARRSPTGSSSPDACRARYSPSSPSSRR